MPGNTIDQSVLQAAQRSLKEQQTLDTQVRKAVNSIYQAQRTKTTAGTGVATTIWSDPQPLPFNCAYRLEAKVQATNPGATISSYAIIERVQLYGRGTSGAGAKLGVAQDKIVLRSNVAFNLTFEITADYKPYVQITDGGIAVMDWKIWIELRRDV